MTEAAWSFMTINWGVLADPESWKRQEQIFPYDLQREYNPAEYLTLAQ